LIVVKRRGSFDGFPAFMEGILESFALLQVDLATAPVSPGGTLPIDRRARTPGFLA